jgi:hypothetical protein
MTECYYPLHKYWMHHKDEQKRAQKCSYLVSTNMIKKIYVFSINNDGARENETLILLPTLSHYHHLFQLCLPKNFTRFFSLGFRCSWCYRYNFQTKSLKVQAF